MASDPKVAEYELYKRIKLLGEGAFGKAYLVECLQDNTKWVTKYMDLNAMSQKEKDETITEARILELLDHPNIVKFREVYTTKKGKLCIVMEYADGGDIAKKIKDQKNQYFQENQILDWFTQICLALKHVHDRKILHRDLKGQNIFLTQDNRVKLGDFGIARVLGRTVEKAKTMVGTPYYLSPEIIESKPYSFKSDIWSLGAVLYELCALKPPFNAESLHFLALKIVRGQFNPIPGHYSRELKTLIGMMLQVNPERRPTIQEILKQPIILNRIKGFLTESVRQSEFAHTIMHNKVFKPQAGLHNVKQIANELPCPPNLMPQKSYPPQENKKIDQPPLQQQQSAPANLRLPAPTQLPVQQLQINQLKPPVIQMISPQSRPESRNIPQQQQKLLTPQQQQYSRPQTSQQQQPAQIKTQVRPAPVQAQPPRPQAQQQQANLGLIIVSNQPKKPVQVPVPINPTPQKQRNSSKNRVVDEVQRRKEEEERQKFQKIKHENETKRLEQERRQKEKERLEKDKKEQERLEHKKRREELRKQMREDLAQKRGQQNKNQPFEELKNDNDQFQDLEEYNSEPEETIEQPKQIEKAENSTNGNTRDQDDLDVYNSDEETNEIGVSYDPLVKQDPYLVELQELLQNVDKAVQNLPSNEKQEVYEFKTEMLKSPIKSRDDDYEEPEDEQRRPESDKHLRALSKEEDESLIYLQNDQQKRESLRQTLIIVLGEDIFNQACVVLKQQIDKFDLEQIEKQHQSSNFKSLLPFMAEDQIKKFLPLLFSYIVIC